MILLKALVFFLPWFIKRRILRLVFGYKLAPKAYIGFAWVFPKVLIMENFSRIDHFTVAIHLDKIEMHEYARIGRSNWITGFSTTNKRHFSHQKERISELVVEESAAITKNHHLDCTNSIHIGKFSTIAGYQSQLLTHSIDIIEGRQSSAPISIGEYAFVGTNVVILGGSALPDKSVLGAKSLLNKTFSETYTLYAGVPAVAVKKLPESAIYFNRENGFVY